ncbi:MAG: lipopolysaccharide assembly protein LapA domain-containing protein [Acidimicrobiales bacterium]
MADTPPAPQDPQQHETPSELSPSLAETAPPHPTLRTRISGTWVGVIIATLVLTLLLVFILQNTKQVKISYFTAHGALPLGVGLLLAAIGGVLFAGVVGSLRIWQLRHRLGDAEHSSGHSWRRRNRKAPKAA